MADLKANSGDAPSGFEHVVEALRPRLGADAVSVAREMIRRGYRSHSEAGRPYDADALYRRYSRECGGAGCQCEESSPVEEAEEANPWMGAGGKFAKKGQGEFRGVKSGYKGDGATPAVSTSGSTGAEVPATTAAAPRPSPPPKLDKKTLAKTAAAAAAVGAVKQGAARLAAPHIANSPMAFNVPRRRSFAGTMGAAIGDVIGGQLGLDHRSSRKIGRIAGNLASKGARKYAVPLAVSAVGGAAAGAAGRILKSPKVVDAATRTFSRNPKLAMAAFKVGNAAGMGYQALRKKAGLKTVFESGAPENEWSHVTESLGQRDDDLVEQIVHVMRARGYDPKREASALLKRLKYECERNPELIESSYFSTCERNELGHCVTHGDGALAKAGHAVRSAGKAALGAAKRVGQIGIDSGVINPYTVALGGALATGALSRRFGKQEAQPGARIPSVTVRESDPAGCVSGFRIRGFLPAVDAQKLREASGLPDTKDSVPVVLITEGRGNRKDRNYYPASTIAESAKVFEGVKSFLDHPTADEEHKRPERSVRDVCGWFSDVRTTVIDGKTADVANFNFSANQAGSDARGLVESDLRYREQNPDGVLVGFSLNAEGPSHLEMLDGEQWNVVDGIERCMSVDLVTFPARGGRVVSGAQANQWRRRFEGELVAA